jgi:hypothetical protein
MGAHPVMDGCERSLVRNGQRQMMQADIGTAIEGNGALRIGEPPQGEHDAPVGHENRRIVGPAADNIPVQHVAEETLRGLKVGHCESDVMNADGELLGHGYLSL